jgi:hypothetical protein
VLDRTTIQNADAKYRSLLAALRDSEALKDLEKLDQAVQENQELRAELRELLRLLTQDDRTAELRRQREDLERALKRIQELIGGQERVRAQTELTRKDPHEIAKDQRRIEERTRDLLERKDGASATKEGKPQGEAKEANGNDRPGGESKPAPEGDNPASGSKGGSARPGAEPGESAGGPKSDCNHPHKDLPDEGHIRKQIRDAADEANKAARDLDRRDRDEAVPHQDNVIDKFKDVEKRLKERLRQVREEEVERVSASLVSRIEFLLQRQTVIRDGTVRVAKGVEGREKKVATRADAHTANALSDEEEELVRQAGKAIQLLQETGGVVAFMEVFQQVRTDMETVTKRLRKTDVGEVTVAIENDVLATLQEMLDALKKSREERERDRGRVKDGPHPEDPPRPFPPAPPEDPRVVNDKAELKIIRGRQERINGRTALYGKRYEGEQAAVPGAARNSEEREHLETIQRELKDLAGQQEQIRRATRDFARSKVKD